MEWIGDARLAAGPEATWYLETAFTPGEHLGTVYDDPTTPVVVTGIEEVTAIRIPSGRLVVDAPWHDDETWEYERGLPTSPPRELAVRIPRAPTGWRLRGRRGRTNSSGSTSTALRAPRPACASVKTSWSGGRWAWVSTTISTGFSRASRSASAPTPMWAASPTAGAWMALTAPFRAYVDGRPVPRDSEQLPGWCERVTDESQQADLVTFTAESGGVVWLGRTKTGDVAAIVVTSGMPGAKA